MKLKHLILLVVTVITSSNAFSQQSTTKSKAPAPKKIVKCHIPSDKKIEMNLTLAQVQAWADSVPLQVICDDLKNYKLYNFDFTIMTASPMKSTGYGTGNGGIPLLARRAINEMKPKDTVIIKNATYLDAKGVEQKLPVIAFSIKEDEPAK